MLEAKTTEQKITVDDKGIPKQVSESKPTDSQPAVSPITKIKVNKLGEEVELEKVVSGYNRGLQYDKLQSEHQKQQADMKKLQDERDTLNKRLNEIEMNKLIETQLDMLGVAPGSGEDRDDTSWPTDDKPKPDLKEVVRQISEVTKQPTQQLLEKLGIAGDVQSIDEIVNQRLQAKEAEFERKRELERWATQQRNAEKKQLEEKYGDVLSDAEKEEILNKLDYAMTSRLEAGRNLNDPEKLAEAWANSQQFQFEVADRLAKAHIAKEQADKKKAVDEMVATGNFPGVTKRTNEDRKPIMNETERLKRLAEMREEAVKKMETYERLTRT